MRLIFADKTAKWVPFATVAAIVIVCWGGMVWESLEFGFATIFCFWLALVLLVGVFLQGWLYWKDQVETLSMDGSRAEAVLMRWVGWGKRVRFAAGDTAGWRTIAKSTDATALSSIEFTAKGTPLSLSFLTPQVADLDALSTLAPEFFAKVKTDFPNLASKSAA